MVNRTAMLDITILSLYGKVFANAVASSATGALPQLQREQRTPGNANCVDAPHLLHVYAAVT